MHGQIDFEGGTLIDLGNLLAFRRTRSELKQLNKWHLFKCILPFYLVKADKPDRGRGYGKGEVGTGRAGRDEKSYIQFHYDVGNAFYQLFLDERMIYTCAYFTDRSNSLDQAQRDKLEMICRKLRLQPGERFLDIGCGWGGLVCYAAEYFGVEAHGVTLSQEQFDYAQAEIERRGLTDRVRVDLRDYRDLTGQFDKISSIGMYEAIGVAAIPEYLHKIRSLLSPAGLFLNHGITRRSKKKKQRFAGRPEQRALLRYIFPGRRARRYRQYHRASRASPLRGPRRRGLAGPLCPDDPALVRTPHRQPGEGGRAGGRSGLPHLGRLSGRQLAGLCPWLRAHLPNPVEPCRAGPAAGPGDSCRSLSTNRPTSRGRLFYRCLTQPLGMPLFDR